MQIDAVGQTGYFVQRGFSGAPVRDTKLNKVVGMVVAADTQFERRVAFMIPAAVLVEVCRDIPGAAFAAEDVLPAPVWTPKLPANFVARDKELQEVKKALLSQADKKVVITAPSRRTDPDAVALYGMAGVGKTVVATAVAWDTDVRRVFIDGIFWLSIGREPKLDQLQSHLAEELGRTVRGFRNPTEGRDSLRGLLADRSCLLILDDVWDPRHVDSFDVLGSRCRMLVTTRKEGLVRDLSALACKVEVLQDDQATELFAGSAGQATDGLPSQAHRIIERCGNLPLALAMVGKMAGKRPDRWSNILDRLRNADLGAINQYLKDYEHPSLLAAVQVSVDDLPEMVRERYLDFAEFPEDTPIPEQALCTFWKPQGLSEYDTQDVLDQLVDVSLLGRDDQGRLTLHDLQRDYLRARAGDLTALHQRLVEAYKGSCHDGWHSGPNDGLRTRNHRFESPMGGLYAPIIQALTAPRRVISTVSSG